MVWASTPCRAPGLCVRERRARGCLHGHGTCQGPEILVGGGRWVGWGDLPSCGQTSQGTQTNTVRLKPSRAPVKRRTGHNTGTHAPGKRLPRLGVQAQTSHGTHMGRGGTSAARRCRVGAGEAGGLWLQRPFS